MRRRVEPLRREVEVPHKLRFPTCPIAAFAAVAMLSWVSALSAPDTSRRSEAKRLRPGPERQVQREDAAPTPVAAEYDCEFGELIDCNYGGQRR